MVGLWVGSSCPLWAIEPRGWAFPDAQAKPSSSQGGAWRKAGSQTLNVEVEEQTLWCLRTYELTHPVGEQGQEEGRNVDLRSEWPPSHQNEVLSQYEPGAKTQPQFRVCPGNLRKEGTGEVVGRVRLWEPTQ